MLQNFWATLYIQRFNCSNNHFHPNLIMITAELILSGWGESELANYSFTPSLRETNLTHASLDECKKGIEEEHLRPVVLKHQLCTRIVSGMRASFGDSGSPVFQLREKGNVSEQWLRSIWHRKRTRRGQP